MQERPHLQHVERGVAGPGPRAQHRQRQRAADHRGGGHRRRDLELPAQPAAPRSPPPAPPRRRRGRPAPTQTAPASRALQGIAARRGEYRSPLRPGPNSLCRRWPTAEQIELQGRRVAVTGANGFIGSAICRALAAEGAEVVGIEVFPEHEAELRAAGVEPRIADVADRAAIGPRSRTPSWSSTPPPTCASGARWRTSCASTSRAPRTCWTPPRPPAPSASSTSARSSSTATRTRATRSEHAFRRAVGVPYIDTKSASDAIAARRGAVIVRPGDVYGPGSVPWLVRPVQLMASRPDRPAEQGRRHDAARPTSTTWSPRSCWRCGAARPGRSYTVWDGHGVSFADYYGMLARELDLREPPKLPKPLLFAGRRRDRGRLQAARPPAAVGRHGVTFLDRRGHRLERARPRGARLVALGGAARGDPPQRRVDPGRGNPLICR